jgi:acylphosphatase
MSDQRARLHAVIFGRVQGVGFRMNTADEAQRLGLDGWVQNNFDRTVEVMAEGPRAVLEEFLTWLQHGPPLARVTNVVVDWWDARGDLDPFEVR